MIKGKKCRNENYHYFVFFLLFKFANNNCISVFFLFYFYFNVAVMSLVEIFRYLPMMHFEGICRVERV